MSEARVLIVEDEIVIVRGLEQALEKLGYTVCGFAFSGEEALDLVEEEKPDLVLVDIFLRGKMDGIELVQEITSRFEIPTIYLTAYSSKEVLDRAKLTGPFGYIVKPFRERQLKVNIELALERSREERKRKAEVFEYLKTIEELALLLGSRTEELETLAGKHRSAQREMEGYRHKIDGLRDELTEVNKALLALTRQMEKTRAVVELEMAASIRMRILPVLRQLGSDPSLENFHTELEMLRLHLHQLSSGLSKETLWCSALSSAELRIATLIQNGCTSEQIAARLHISLDTVKTHRKRMRRKLNLSNNPTNLSTFLKFRTGEAVHN
jgi:DNA-binding NarL/FixJ family response regulator